MTLFKQGALVTGETQKFYIFFVTGSQFLSGP